MNEAHTTGSKTRERHRGTVENNLQVNIGYPLCSCEGAKKGFYNSMYYFHCASHFLKK